MAKPLLEVFCYALISGQGVAASFHLDVQPTLIAPRLTKSLIINCTFHFESSSNFSGLLSLIISKEDGQNNETQTFQDLVSLNAFTGDQVNLLSHLTATVSGHIGMRDDSFISLYWAYPSTEQSGVYRCSANGMDRTGHPRGVSMTTEVTSQKPDLQLLTDAVRILQSESDELKEELEQEKKKRIEMTIASLFEISEEYQGRYYLLSRLYFSKADVAETVCEGLGGYLAEIDNAAEYGFIKNFLSTAAPEIDHALFGATKEGPYGQWSYRFSKKPLVYFNWDTHEPDHGDSHNCMVLYKSKPPTWKMHDNPCDRSPSEWKRHYLCETPITD